MKKLIPIALVFALVGCMASVTVDKRPNIALPIVSQDNKTNDWVIVD